MTISKWISWIVISAVGLFGVATSAGAAEFPYPKVEFSADLTMSIQQAGSEQPYVMQGKIKSAMDKERREVASFGRTTVIISDRKKDQSWTLMPDQKMYMTNQGSDDPERMIRDGELKLTKLGSEQVNGHSTTKYKIESTDKGQGTFSGHAWFTKQNIPVRFTGTANDGGVRQNIRIDYSNIKVGRQNPKLFVVPADYRPLNTGMGAPGQGMTPEQMEQFMKMMKNQKGAN